jgi:predicted nucleotide-binding protein
MMDASKLGDELKAKLKEFDDDETIKKFYEGTFRAWSFEIDSLIIRGTGSARLVSKWRQATKGLPYPDSMMIIGFQEGPLEFMFESRLPEVRATLVGIIAEIEKFGIPAANDLEVMPRGRSKAFIAHGGDSEALNRLCTFLSDDLGVTPLVVERLPSEGRSVNENVEHYLDEADAGIVLATADDFVDGKYQPRGNVDIELGRFQERFPGRIVFLLEEGAAFPTNVGEKVWERFTQDNMEKALRKVVRELRAFGLLGVTEA